MRSCAHEVSIVYILRVKMTMFTMWKKSEVKENDKVKVEKVTKINLKIISKPRALLQTREKTCAKFL